MWPDLQFPVDLVIFSEEIFSGKLHFWWSAIPTHTRNYEFDSSIFKASLTFHKVVLTAMRSNKWGIQYRLAEARLEISSMQIFQAK